MPSHPERVRRNYDDVERAKPLAQQACKDCGCYGCLIPVPHKVGLPQADGDSTR
jgi:hypothetical protein